MANELQNVNNNWVYQSNRLVESSYTLTVVEQKLIRLLASMIHKDDDDIKEYEFKTKELIKVLNTSDSRFYRDIDNITDLLMQRIIKIRNVNTSEFVKYHWVDTAKYVNGILKLKINKDLKPFYLGLDCYTKYQLRNIMQFKSTYSFRLYELFKQYEGIGHRILTVDGLRDSLNISKDQYPKYANLKQKVINVAVKEINVNTDLVIDYNEIKEVRKIVSIQFSIRKKDKAQSEISETSLVPVFFNDRNMDLVRQVVNQELTDLEVHRILDAANLDIEKIKEKYNIISQFGKVNNLVGAMITALKENWTTTNKRKVSTFNDYEQREYNFDDLEKKLLGWE
ncbi:replication initiation protein [Clostridium tagluense]|uniref:replication initiation protein n=1 Tax=Clostridium TaxID=1485 RepID=UPI0013E99512|nr:MULTISPECIES: replication initiation protein [Clostridium]MBZ9626249.1 replication initiation protein [Clostridium sp. FP2]MCB2313773.1 replication initiation protein [Clostridium tagluense]MCB2318590.1 replication initiation protein [Clostridium tagluense]MCB2323436.1 replication initiation protein [Clostridium tagluense]MCB2328271.1 replication initiation protein [Clostridium tagluense]